MNPMRCILGLVFIFYLSLSSLLEASDPYRCPVITRQQLTDACWGKDKQAITKGMTIYGIKCPWFGLGKKLSLIRERGVDKIYEGNLVGENTPQGLSVTHPICAYKIHSLGRETIVNIAIDDSSYKRGELQGSELAPSELMEGLSPEMKPILPYDPSKGPWNTNQITPLALKAVDRSFIEQTGGGIKRAIGTGKLLLLVRQQYVYGYDIQRLSQEDRARLADLLLIKYLGGPSSEKAKKYQQTGELSVDDLANLYETLKKDILNKRLWTITPDTWNSQGKPLEEQFQKEEAIFLNTLFPDPSVASKITMTNEEHTLEIKKIAFLKRLFVALAWLKYTPLKNGNPETLKAWSFPLASALGRGGRILFVSPNEGIKSLFDYLFNGRESTTQTEDSSPKIYNRRSLASHGLSKKDGYVIELSLKGLKGAPQNISAGIQGYHLAVNIPLGGIGFPQIDGALIGPGGTSIDPVTGRTLPKRQHGHLYINYNSKMGAFLIGLESSAPGFKNMFGDTHTVNGAFGSFQFDQAVTGGDKWATLEKNFEIEVPNTYGGKRLVISSSEFALLKKYCREIFKLPYQQQRDFFKDLLSSTGPEALELLRVFYATLSIPGVPNVEDILDDSSPSGLNLNKVHNRQIAMRQKGYADDISTKIVLLQGQLSQEKKIRMNKQELEKELSQISLTDDVNRTQIQEKIKDLDQKMSTLEKITANVTDEIKEILGLTDLQIQSIPDYDSYKNRQN